MTVARGTIINVGNSIVFSRHTDYEHYVKCGKCGWEGWSAQMKHDYQHFNIGGNYDCEPMDFCPECGQSEEFAEAFITCTRSCGECLDRFLCWSVLQKIPINTIALCEVKNG
jgi:ribosomal protein S27AE